MQVNVAVVSDRHDRHHCVRGGGERAGGEDVAVEDARDDPTFLVARRAFADRRAHRGDARAHLRFRGASRASIGGATQGLAGGVVALVVVGAVGMWVGGVNRLYAEPPRHGWPWDRPIGNVNFKMVPATLSRLSTDRRLSEMTEAAFGQVALNGVSAEVFAFDPSGTAPPEVLSGRNPTASDEIALGSAAHRLDLRDR